MILILALHPRISNYFHLILHMCTYEKIDKSWIFFSDNFQGQRLLWYSVGNCLPYTWEVVHSIPLSGELSHNDDISNIFYDQLKISSSLYYKSFGRGHSELKT